MMNDRAARYYAQFLPPPEYVFVSPVEAMAAIHDQLAAHHTRMAEILRDSDELLSTDRYLYDRNIHR